MYWAGSFCGRSGPPVGGPLAGPQRWTGGGQMCSVLSPAALWPAVRGGAPVGRGVVAASSSSAVPEKGWRRARVGPVLLGVLLALGAAALTPAPALADTKTWMGQFLGDRFWTTPGNWVGGVAPVPGDDLVFPANAIHFVTTNDFPDGTMFNSITIQASGYTLNTVSGNAVKIAFSPVGVTADYPSGSS